MTHIIKLVLIFLINFSGARTIFERAEGTSENCRRHADSERDRYYKYKSSSYLWMNAPGLTQKSAKIQSLTRVPPESLDDAERRV